MTDYKPKALRRALERKGMTCLREDGHHIMLVREYPGGPKLVTRISRGSKAGYDDFLLAKVGRQLGLHLIEVKRLVECPMSTQDWDDLISERCTDGVNPLSPHLGN